EAEIDPDRKKPHESRPPGAGVMISSGVQLRAHLRPVRGDREPEGVVTRPLDWGSWEGDRERKYIVGLEVSADERLAWLEEMVELAVASGALPKRRDAWG